MGRQCFDLEVHIEYAMPQDEVRKVIRKVVRKHSDFELQEMSSHDEYVCSMPVMVKGYKALYIGESMPKLVQLFDWNSKVTTDSLIGQGPAAELAISAYKLCQNIIEALEEALFETYEGRISREDIRYKVGVYLRIS